MDGAVSRFFARIRAAVGRWRGDRRDRCYSIYKHRQSLGRESCGDALSPLSIVINGVATVTSITRQLSTAALILAKNLETGSSIPTCSSFVVIAGIRIEICSRLAAIIEGSGGDKTLIFKRAKSEHMLNVSPFRVKEI